MGRNGQSVFDMVTGGWQRKVVTINGRTPGVAIPTDHAEKHGVELGDDVVIVPSEDDESVLELHFE